MSQFFFSMFPTLSYNSFLLTNIMARVVVKRALTQQFSNFLPYEIPDGERPDQLAFNYYGNAFYDWLIFLINDITNPYYDWPLSSDDFQSMIIQRYGTVANAQSTIRYWESNWYASDTRLPIAAYAALNADQKQFWSPVITAGNIVIAYERKENDISVTTNQINQLTGIANNVFDDGDVVQQANNTSNYGTVCWANSSAINIQHVFGTWVDSTTYTIQKNDGTGSTNAISQVLKVVIPSDQLTYFTTVSNYDFEVNQNESKRIISLLDKQFLPAAEKLVQKALQGQVNI